VTRVAALQFASGTDVDANLETCLRMIDAAAQHEPQVMVLPEFCNHISWYDDAEHARRVSLEVEGEFLAQIAARAALHNSHLVLNVSLRRGGDALTITSLMYGPGGDLLAQADKQTLMGHENFWFQRARAVSEVVATGVGRLAMFPCRDGVTFETPRGLALRGAQLFCDSLNSFALDEASLHVPARAPENRVFLAAANKVGPLIPADLLEQVSEETHIPLQFLYGAGESQIVSPAGEVLARGPRDEEAVIWADLDLSLADNKARGDGTHIFASRQPTLYRQIAEPPQAPAMPPGEVVEVACLNPGGSDDQAVANLQALVQDLPPATRLAVLPELFASGWRNGKGSETVVQVLSRICKSRQGLLLCTSLPQERDGGSELCAVLISESGIIARQAQLHSSERFPDLLLGTQFQLVDVPWGRLALLTADDMRYPEMAKLAAIGGAHLLVVPGKLLEPWESRWALPSRAAENRVCVAYASEPQDNAGSLIAGLHRDFTLMTPWQQREFDGYINQPLLTRQGRAGKLISATLDLETCSNKLMSAQTDLIADRPWRLSGELVSGGSDD
jgi:deaminated glutathione amidase